MSVATIERLDFPKAWIFPPQSGAGTTMFKERAVLPCGCAFYVGVEAKGPDGKGVALGGPVSPKWELGVAWVPCSNAHHDFMGEAHRTYAASLEDGEARPAVEVGAEILDMCAKEAGVA